jgi:large subunit ribosomal protein L28
MSRICQICGKRPSVGNSVSRRGRAKHLGGVGRKITGITKRQFKPNLQRVRALHEGAVKRVRVCTKCLRSGKITKPPIRPKFDADGKALPMPLPVAPVVEEQVVEDAVAVEDEDLDVDETDEVEETDKFEDRDDV